MKNMCWDSIFIGKTFLQSGHRVTCQIHRDLKVALWETRGRVITAVTHNRCVCTRTQLERSTCVGVWIFYFFFFVDFFFRTFVIVSSHGTNKPKAFSYRLSDAAVRRKNRSRRSHEQFHHEHHVASDHIRAAASGNFCRGPLMSCSQVLPWCEYGVDFVSIFNVSIF